MNERKGADRDGREAIIYVAAAVPFLLWRLSLSYLRMRRKANKEGHEFYMALLRNGVPREQARELADIYSTSISLTQMIREMGPFTS
jgi:hypothetical protein